MEINSERQDNVTIVRPVGFVDAVTSGALADALNGQLKAGNSCLVVDLDRLDYMSSAGLRVLLAAVKDARRQGGDLRLANAKAEVSQVLEMSGFTKVLQVYATLGEAVGSYGMGAQ
jgi:anti-sigma B factor antagonist